MIKYVLIRDNKFFSKFVFEKPEFTENLMEAKFYERHIDALDEGAGILFINGILTDVFPYEIPESTVTIVSTDKGYEVQALICGNYSKIELSDFRELEKYMRFLKSVGL